MTSMPASRRARAMTLAPRSWPSRPGLATSTRIFLSVISSLRPLRLCGERYLGHGDFFVGAEDGAEGVADFAQGGVGAHAVEDARHRVLVAAGGGLQILECLGDAAVVALAPHLGKPFTLLASHRLVNLENLQRRLLSSHIVVDADDDLLLSGNG